MLKKMVKTVLRTFDLDLVRVRPDSGGDATRLTPAGRDPAAPDLEPEFLALYAACRPFTMTSRERMYAAYQAARYVVQHDIPGAVVECGVWKGGSTMMMVKTLLALGVTDRDVYLFDTFEGMSEPDNSDVEFTGQDARNEWERSQRAAHNEWCYSSLDEVKANLRSTGYPLERVHFVKGKVEETIPGTLPGPTAILRLDTDWYESTRHELIYLYPLLAERGILIIDDYGHWQGARQATDEYFTEARVPAFLSRIDYTGRLLVKPPTRAVPG